MIVASSGDVLVLTAVDYILFTTIDVDTELNYNEVSDARYVSKAELQDMFADQSGWWRALSILNADR